MKPSILVSCSRTLKYLCYRKINHTNSLLSVYGASTVSSWCHAGVNSYEHASGTELPVWYQSNSTHPALCASSWCTFEETGGKDLRVGDKRLVILAGGGGALEWDWDWGRAPGPLGPGSVPVGGLSWRERKERDAKRSKELFSLLWDKPVYVITAMFDFQ